MGIAKLIHLTLQSLRVKNVGYTIACFHIFGSCHNVWTKSQFMTMTVSLLVVLLLDSLATSPSLLGQSQVQQLLHVGRQNFAMHAHDQPGG